DSADYKSALRKPDSRRLVIMQKERSGFRQKAEPFNFHRFAALCRDAATANDRYCRGFDLGCASAVGLKLAAKTRTIEKLIETTRATNLDTTTKLGKMTNRSPLKNKWVLIT